MSTTQATEPNLRSNVLWAMARHWGVRLGSAAVFFILARILPPEVIGTYGAAFALVALLQLVSENGLADTIVQSPTITNGAVAAAFWFALGLSLCCGLIALGLAHALEIWFALPGLQILLWVLLLAVPLSATGEVAQALLRRRLQYKNLALKSLTAVGLSAAAGLLCAIAGLGIWSMAIQFVLFNALNFALVWRYLDPAIMGRPDFTTLPAVLAFSVPVFVARLFHYLSSRFVEIMLALRYGPEALAFFLMGARFTSVLSQFTTAVSTDVALTSFARLTDDRAALTQAFRSALRNASLLSVPAFAGLAAIAPEFSALLFGAAGADVAPYMICWSLLALFQACFWLNGTLLTALGRPGVPTIMLGLQAILTLLIVCPLWGLTAPQLIAIIALAFSAIYPLYALVTCRILRMPVGDYFGITLPHYAAASVMIGAVALCRLVFSIAGIDPLLGLPAHVIVGATAFLATIGLLRRSDLRELLQSATPSPRQDTA